MLNKKYVFWIIFITLFFLTIAFLTTFRLAIYSFIVCYIGVIIAKSRNKRLKVPVIDFFVLTFSVGIFFAFIYSYSPRLQYYEFLMLHSRWEVSQVSNIEQKQIYPLSLNSDFIVGLQADVDLTFSNSHGNNINKRNFNFYETNFINLFSQKNNLDSWLTKDISYYNSSKDLFIFKKPNKEIYKFFSKGKILSNSHTAVNFAFSIFFTIIFLFCIFNIVFKFKTILSALLNQYPKNTYLSAILLLFYIIAYSLITYITVN